MDETIRNDYFWLMSDAAIPLLRQAGDSFRNHENPVRLARTLRADTTNSRSALIMEQAQLRLRAVTKFAHADQMFFTRRGLEQATGAGIARYKASRFSNCASVADVCCGVGGDLIGLAQRTDLAKTIGVDADELTASFARHNLSVASSNSDLASVQHLTFEQFSNDALDGLHCDPDRRGKGVAKDRTVHGNRFEPSLESVIARAAGFALVGIKIAPATPRTDDWPVELEREWIGDRRECKQQVLWLGSSAEHPGHRTATCVDDRGVAKRFSVPESSKAGRLPLNETIGSFLYEPHPTVLAGKMVDILGKQFELQRIAKDVAYLTGDNADQMPLLTSFRVREVLPMHLRKVAELLKADDVGHIEVKRRGVEQIAGEQFAKLKLSGSKRTTVFLTRHINQRIAVIADRMVFDS